MPNIGSSRSDDPRDPELTPGFSCTMRNDGSDVAWVRVTGELDIATASELEHRLRQAEQRARRVVLDLRDLTFTDTSGVHVIRESNIRAGQAGCRPVLVRGPKQVDRVFALTGASEDLEIVDLDPAEPAVQAIGKLAPTNRAP